MKVVKKIHPGYSPQFRILGKYQYLYTSDKGQISLVELPNYFHDGITLWEIYSLKGNLFDDVERFESKEKAEKKIKEILFEKENKNC